MTFGGKYKPEHNTNPGPATYEPAKAVNPAPIIGTERRPDPFSSNQKIKTPAPGDYDTLKCLKAMKKSLACTLKGK
jgi:hypothetical protein